MTQENVEYILEEFGFNSMGKKLSCGFYAGPNKKYPDMFDRVQFKQYAKRFQSHAEAKAVADSLNRNGYKFIVEEVCIWT